MILDKEYIKKVHQIINDDENVDEIIKFSNHAISDLEKQNYPYTKKDIINFFKKGKYYSGKELYPTILQRYNRKYCIARRSLFTFNLILIWFEIIKGILIIHIQHLNRSSKEGKIYYNKL